jgi:hypothetical protein
MSDVVNIDRQGLSRTRTTTPVGDKMIVLYARNKPNGQVIRPSLSLYSPLVPKNNLV